MSDKVPDWATEMAWGVFGPHPKAVVRTPQRKLLVLGIASALLSAYRRGVEDSERAIMDEAAKPVMDGCSVAYAIDDFRAAIRRLGEAE